MRLPRDFSGDALARALGSFGYRITRQTGSHLRLSTSDKGEHHVTIPRHDSLRVGTLAAVLAEVAGHLEITRDDLARRLFGE